MKFLCLFLFLILHLFTSYAADWCYDVEKASGRNCKGTSEWSEEFPNCANNKQSPINIITCKATLNKGLKPFQFEGYDKEGTYLLKNNGHSAELVLTGEEKSESAGKIAISGGGLSGTYTASQLHFHWGSKENPGSEHTLNGERYPIELHIVHKQNSGRSETSGGSTASGGIAVLGFFFTEGKSNENYKNLIDSFKNIIQSGANTTISNIKLQDMIPEEKNLKLFYRYEGSLTTPPCDETVTWTVFPEVIELSKDQIDTFYNTLSYTNGKMQQNFRPLQKLNGRTIYTSGVDAILPLSRYMLISLFVCLLTSIS